MKKIIYALLLCSLFFACNKKNDDPAPSAPSTSSNETTASFAFLRDNHQWNYDYNLLGTTGSYNMVTDSIESNLYKITSTADMDNENSDVEYWFVSGPYLKTYVEGETKDKAEIIYKSNPSLNDTWKTTEATSNYTTTYKVINTDTTIVCSAGTFEHCKKIQLTFNYAFNIQYNYWNESYGLVLQTGALALDLTDKNFRQANTVYGYKRW